MKEHPPDDLNWYNCQCPVCGKRFHLKPSHVKDKEHCCSIECLKEVKRKIMSGEGNHQYGLKGSKNASWKRDEKETRYGYIARRVLDHPFRDKQDFVLEHRLVAEKYLLTPECTVYVDGKPYLSKDYVVHHKDFCRWNNKPENLQIMTESEHQRLHATLNPRPKSKESGQFMKDNAIKVKRVTETALVPSKQTDEAAGFDLYADITEPAEINPQEWKMIPTGIAMSIKKGYAGAIYARSGKATKQGLRPATCVSVIDSDYRGMIYLPMYNDSNEVQTIRPQERVAQILFYEVPRFELEVVDTLDETERGNNGFGSTGR